MVRITEQLVRKKSEHNELMISTLEEISLHQEDIERIEHVQNWCRDLKILLLQSNIIARIENLHKLKRLEYLNLALNNIERIENLELCESLTKLDLTLNFIGQLTSVESLRGNYNFRELILTGNPCTDYEGYREYVIGALPQLTKLDCVDITDTVRLQAAPHFAQNRERIVQLQAMHQIGRDEQKLRVQADRDRDARENEGLDEDTINERFWKKNSEHCPETRKDIVQQQRKSQKDDAKPVAPKKQPRLFAECGRPYSVNQPKLEFNFNDHPDRFELNLHVYKFMDTSLIEVDVQPKYVRVVIRQKVFQMALGVEVRCGEATSKRSLTTGHLLIVMPKLDWTDTKRRQHSEKEKKSKTVDRIPTSDSKCVNYKNIVGGTKVEDNPEVPPLVW